MKKFSALVFLVIVSYLSTGQEESGIRMSAFGEQLEKRSLIKEYSQNELILRLLFMVLYEKPFILNAFSPEQVGEQTEELIEDFKEKYQMRDDLLNSSMLVGENTFNKLLAVYLEDRYADIEGFYEGDLRVIQIPGDPGTEKLENEYRNSTVTFQTLYNLWALRGRQALITVDGYYGYAESQRAAARFQASEPLLAESIHDPAVVDKKTMKLLYVRTYEDFNRYFRSKNGDISLWIVFKTHGSRIDPETFKQLIQKQSY